MNNIITTVDLEYEYKNFNEIIPGVLALKGVSLDIIKGEFVVILGRNGSGKSTFARLLNALLIPTKGQVKVNGMDTRDSDNIWKIRRTAGMVMQNPDNQIVGTIVEEDVAFGPENLGVPSNEIRGLVDQALHDVSMTAYKKNAPHLLSGGQKQRVAIAGILAMKPECLVLDEATAMLDPLGRREVLNVIRKLNKEEGITVIHITHYMEEASQADRVIVIDDGKAAVEGSPQKVFSDVELIKGMGLDVPQVTELLYELNKEGYNFSLDIINTDEAYAALAKELSKQ